MHISELLKNKKTVHDLILIGILLVVALIALLLFNSRESGDYVLVRVNGEECGRYLLSTDATYTLNGGTNILVIEDGKAYLSYANCPDQICVKQGKISKGGQVITCLPNKLTVTVYSSDSDIDVVIG